MLKHYCFNSYLFNSKINIDNNKKIHIIMGNEAADLDSIVSAIVYGWFKTFLTKNHSNELFIPLINIPAADFKLRTEVVWLFSEVGIETQNLCFIDEINMEEMFKAGKLSLTLVDHNKLSGKQEYLSSCVKEIIDHHKDEEAYNLPSENKTIEPVGSCATLVAEKIFVAKGKIGNTKAAFLLLSTIILDSANFGINANIATEKDKKFAKRLIAETSIDTNKIFTQLQFEKFNTSSLSSFDILRKDYKEWVVGSKKIGFSSALISLEKWLKKDSLLLDSVEKFYTESSLAFLFIMIAYREPDFKRELILYSKDKKLREQVYNFLQKEEIQLETPLFNVPIDERAEFYVQKNTKLSRKKLQPIVQQFFSFFC